ncbi:unnamed protein product [Mycena citricolor]|uniref:Peptidase A1 domain-containing protein n=1 Tax=Mycena citricolor TaxID=2018698 RepID=A0AAD2HU59_9AGAR|nr:unnamed protein product [Mycena citricolor]
MKHPRSLPLTFVMFLLSVPHLVLLCSVFTAANPLQYNYPRAVPINRSFRHRPPTHILSVFQPGMIKWEIQSLPFKYRNVQGYLRDISSFDGVLNHIAVEEEIAEHPISLPPVPAPRSMPLEDYISDNMDVMYYGLLGVGTPSQSLSVDIDTGSADFWLPVKCTNCYNRQFDDAQSSTCRSSDESFSVYYGSGSVFGTIMQDTITLDGLQVSDVYFGAASAVYGDFVELPNDGLLGMAFSNISQSKKPTLFETLVNKQLIPASMFSLHLARNQAKGSELYLGGIDPFKVTGPVTWIPLLSKAYWSVSMDAITINAHTVLPTLGTCAIVDSGTTLIYLPASHASAFYAMIPSAKPAPDYGPEFYSYRCSDVLDIAFSFGGHSFSINQADFNLGRTSQGSSDCVGGILALGDGFPSDIAIIGDEFLKSWYSTYDSSGVGRVGFSPDINNT